MKENVTKTYKKAPEKLQKSINLETKFIATKLKLNDQIEKLVEAQAYVTLKDHKENFRSKPSCRLINPSKNETGKISKIVLEKINKKLFLINGRTQMTSHVGSETSLTKANVSSYS